MKQLMRAVVTSGTAAGIGLGSTVYAKTGTADIKGQEQPNSWLVAFDPTKDVAVACLVLNSGYGAQVAGPEGGGVPEQLLELGRVSPACRRATSWAGPS